MTKIVDKTSTATTDGAHQDTKNYNTTCTRSATTTKEGEKGMVTSDEWFNKHPVWLITPDLARKLLATNERNRKIRIHTVNQYARDMLAGRWRLEGGEISLDKDGKLIDGQHRLRAVISADIPIEFRMQLDTPRDTPFDIGAKRTSGDALRMQGEIPEELSTNRSIALVNALLRNLYGKGKCQDMTNYDRADFINAYADRLLLTIDISKEGGQSNLCVKAGVQAAIFVALTVGVAEGELRDFVRCVNSGIVLSKSQSAAIVLRSMLMEMRFSQTKPVDFILSATEQALWDFIHGKSRVKKYVSEAHPYLIDAREVIV